MTTPSRPEASVTADDVRHVTFEPVRRGGYDTHEVDALLDRIAETLDAHERGGGGPSAPQLHDPEGAAQRLLAAAQKTADTLTAEAQDYADSSRREADEYATSVRSEADEHAARVTASAESQAETIRSVAADEARKVAEEARAALVEQIATLEATRDQLQSDCDALEGHVESQRTRLLAGIDAMRSAVETGDLSVAAPPDTSGASLADVELPELEPEPEQVDVAAVDEPTMAHDMLAEAGEDLDHEAVATNEPMLDATSAADDPGVAGEPETNGETSAVLSVIEGGADAEDPAAGTLGERDRALDSADDDEGPISVFDLEDDVDDDAISADWLDEMAPRESSEGDETSAADETSAGDETSAADEASDEEASDEDSGGLGLFDADADLVPVVEDGEEDLDTASLDDDALFAAVSGDNGDGGPPTRAMPVLGDGGEVSGDRFFEELRQAERDDNALGPLDEDTDAALAAFFEPEDDDRWSDRFGGRR